MPIEFCQAVYQPETFLAEDLRPIFLKLQDEVRDLVAMIDLALKDPAKGNTKIVYTGTFVEIESNCDVKDMLVQDFHRHLKYFTEELTHIYRKAGWDDVTMAITFLPEGNEFSSHYRTNIKLHYK